MASTQIIETNKLKIGSAGAKGLYVGNVESKYAVMTDSASNQTVIYDKVTYNFAVTDLASTVPASGQTYTIAASVSTRTHGNGVVDNVTFSPTSITIPPNTGASYTSSITVTQTTSNLTDEYSFTVAADSVKSISLSLSGASTIPASGGSVSSCTTSATVTYQSGRQVTSFTPTQVKWGTAVTASTKGTTVSAQNSAGTLTCYIVYGGVTSNTASITINQQANAVTNSGLTTISVTSPSGSLGEIPASGGSKTPTLTATGGDAWTSYTSTSTATTTPNKTWVVSMTNSGTFTLKSSTTGQISASTKGTTISNTTTSATATAYAYATANGVSQTGQSTYYVTQQANYVTQLTMTNPTLTVAQIGAGGGTKTDSGANGTLTYKFTSNDTTNTTPGSTYGTLTTTPEYTMTSGNGFTLSNTSNGTVSGTSKGTTISNVTTSNTITKKVTYSWAHSSSYNAGGTKAVSASTTGSATQAGNYVTALTISSAEISYTQIAASGGSSTPTGSDGTVTYNFTSGSDTTTAPGTTYGAISSTKSFALASSANGFTINTNTGVASVDSKGTTISNVTSSDTITKTVTYTWTPTSSYNAGGTQTKSTAPTGKVSQAGNYVKSVAVSGVGVAYAQIAASGGTASDTGSNGSVTYTFTSNSTSTSTPGTTYGSISSGKTYSMTSGNGFTIGTGTGVVTAATKGTTISDVTSSNTVTKTVTWTWTPTASYNAGGTKTNSASNTTKATQGANAITGYTDYQTPTGVSIAASQVPASGGTATITFSPATCSQEAKAVYTSNATASSYTNRTGLSYSTGVTGNSAVSSKGTTISNETTAIATVTGYYWANGKTASTTTAVNQLGNYVTAITMTTPALSIAQFDASGGSKSDTGGNGTVTYKFSSTSTSTTAPGTTYGSINRVNTYTMTSGSGFTLTSTSAGTVSANTKGTTISNATSSNTVTKKVEYTWTPTTDYNAAGTKTVSASTTGNATQAGNYVTSVSVASVGMSYGTQIPAAGGTATPTSGSNGAYTFNYSSGSNTSTAPATTYGSSSVTVSYSMADGQGFTLLNSDTGQVSAETRGTTTATSARTSKTITKTVTLTWTHSTDYSAGGTVSNSGTKTGNASQAKNEYTDSWNNPSITAFAYSTAIPASGGTSAPSVTATQSGTRTWESTSTSGLTNNSFTYSYAMTASGRWTISDGTVSASSRGQVVGNAENSPTVTVTVTGSGSKSNTKTATASQNGNYVTSLAFNTNPSLSYATTIGAGGGTCDPTVSSGTPKFTYSSNATGTTAPGSSAGTLSSGVGTYSMTAANGFSINTSTGVITAADRGTTTGTSRTSSAATVTVTITWTPASGYNSAGTKSTNKSVSGSATQAANSLTNTNYSPSNYTATVSIGNGLTAAGGSATVTYSASHQAYDYYSSGSYNNQHTVYDQAKVEITANGNSRFTMTTVCGSTSSNTTTMTHSSMTTNETTDTVTVKCTNMSNTSTTNTTSKSIVNQVESYTAYQAPSGLSIAVDDYAAAGGTATVTWSGTCKQNAKKVFTSTSTASSYTELTIADSAVTKSVSGNSSANSLGTTFKARTQLSGTVTGTYTANGVSSTTSAVNRYQAANYVTGLTMTNPTLTLGTVNAAGTAVNDTGADGTITYRYASTSTSTTKPSTTNGTLATSYTYTIANTNNGFSINNASSKTGCVKGTSRGTTIGNSQNSSTITKKVTFTFTNKVGSTTAVSTNASGTGTATQAGNYVTGITVTVAAFTYSNIAASGGTSTPTGGDVSYSFKYSSGSNGSSAPSTTYGTSSATNTYSMATSAGFTLNSTSTGVVSADNRTTVTGDSRSATVTKTASITWTPTSSYNAAGTITSSGTKTATCTQDANTVTNSNYSPTSYAASVSIGNGMTAAGGSATVTYSASHTAFNVYSSGSQDASRHTVYDQAKVEITSNGNNRFSMTTVCGSTSSNTTTISHSTMGTTATTDSVTVKCTNMSSTSKTKTAPKSITNSVDSYTDYQTPTGRSLTGTTVAASGTGSSNATVGWSGTASQQAKPVYTSNATGSSYVTLTPSVSTAMTGNGTVSSKGTTISKATTAKTVTGYYWANGKTANTTYYVTQEGNFVTSIETSDPALSYATLDAGGGTSPSSGVDGSITKFNYTSGSSGTTAPTSYGSSGSSISYSMTNGNGFYLTNNVTGAVSAETRGSISGDSRTSNTITKSVTITWTPSSGYGSSVSSTKSATTTATQAHNNPTYVWESVYADPAYITSSYVPASGGTSSPRRSASQDGYLNYPSGVSEDVTNSDFTWSFSMTNNTVWTKSTNFATLGTVSATSRGTETGDTRQSPAISYTCAGAGGKSASGTIYAYQVANAITGTTWGNVTVNTFTYNDVPAKGTTIYPSEVSASQSGTNYYTSGSNSSTSNDSFTYSYARSNTYTYIKTASTFTSTGAVSGTNRTTGVGDRRGYLRVQVTATGQGSKTGTKTCDIYQQANAIESYTDYQNPTGLSLSSNKVSAAGASSLPTVSWNGTCSQQAKAVYTSQSTASSYSTLSVSSPSKSISGNTGSVSSKGTTISNDTTAKTVTGYYWANGKTATTTYYMLQAGNYVTNIKYDYASDGISIPTFPASGGTGTLTITPYTVTGYTFTSGSSASTKPSTTYGNLYSSVTLNNSSADWVTINTSNATVTVASRGTEYGNYRFSTENAVITVYWVHSSTYSAGGTASTSYIPSESYSVTQDGNYTSSTWSNPVVTASYPSGQISAGGGSKSINVSAYQDSLVLFDSGESIAGERVTNGFTYSYSMPTTTGWNLNTSNGLLSASTRGTTTGDARTSGTVTVKAVRQSKTGTTTTYSVQQANALVGHTGGTIQFFNFFYDDPIPAGGGSSYPTVSARQYNVKGYYTSGSYDSTNQTVTLQRGSAGTSWNFKFSAGATAASHFSITASTGNVSAGTLGTTLTSSGYWQIPIEASVTGYSNVVGTYTDGDYNDVIMYQDENTITGTVATSSCTINASWNTIPAAGGSGLAPATYTYSGWVRARYSSGSNDTSYKSLSSLNCRLQTYTASTTPNWLTVTNSSAGTLSAGTNTSTSSTRSKDLTVKLYADRYYQLTSKTVTVTQAASANTPVNTGISITIANSIWDMPCWYTIEFTNGYTLTGYLDSASDPEPYTAVTVATGLTIDRIEVNWQGQEQYDDPSDVDVWCYVINTSIDVGTEDMDLLSEVMYMSHWDTSDMAYEFYTNTNVSLANVTDSIEISFDWVVVAVD